MVLVFDIGGQTTKIALVDNDRHIIDRSLIDYRSKPIKALALLFLVRAQITDFQQRYPLEALCFSTCGIVADDGTMSGMAAVLDYHEVNWKRDLQAFNLPIYVGNDANCALLAELQFGAAQHCKNAAMIVLGTGIGGAIAINNRVLNGYSGEIGCFLETFVDGKYRNLSELASPHNVETKLNQLFNQQHDLRYYFAHYATTPEIQTVLDEMVFRLAKSIVNIVFTVAVPIVVIGGAISNNALFIHKLVDKTRQLLQQSGIPVDVQVVAATFRNDANIFGAYALR